MSIHLINFLTDKKDVKGTVETILEHDCDFFENEEYYREDTLELGYKNEAERVAEEFEKKYSEVTLAMISNLAQYSNGNTQFVAGNGTYSNGYNCDVKDVGDGRVFVCLAYNDDNL